MIHESISPINYEEPLDSNVTVPKNLHCQPVNMDCRSRVLQFLDKFDHIISDCDGVLWLNDQAVPGAPSAINKLRALGKKIIFATNNSIKTREEFQDKLTKLGYHCNLNELFPTSFASSVYLNSIGFNKKGYVHVGSTTMVGSSGICGKMKKIGIDCTDLGYEPTPDHWTTGMADVELDNKVGAVVIGVDNQISFANLVKASTYVNKPGNVSIDCNDEESYPSPRDKAELIAPGAGAYVAAIQAVTGKDLIPLGKPFKYFFDIIRKQHPDIDPMRTVIIGDRLTTDMVFGRNNGLKTLFVMSGNGTHNDMVQFSKSKNPDDYLCVPDFYLNSLDDFNKYL